MGFLKGQVLTPKFTTAEITDSDDRIYYVPIKHTIGDYFLAEIDGKYFAFSLHNARRLTHRSKSGLGKSFQIIQYDTSHFSPINPTTKELELMLKKNSIGKVDRRLHNILSILSRREKDTFGKYLVGKKIFDSKAEAETYCEETGKDKAEIKWDVHNIQDLFEVFKKEEGEFPEQVREINKYLKALDIDHVVTPVRKITEFITDDLIATKPSFLGESVARYQRLDGTLREVTNVPVKPKTNTMKYLIIAFVGVIGVLGAYSLSESGALDGLFEFTDNLSTIQEGFKGIPAPGSFQQGGAGKVVGGVDYSDASIMAKYPDCASMQAAVNAGTLDYNKLTSTMKGLFDSC